MKLIQLSCAYGQDDQIREILSTIKREIMINISLLDCAPYSNIIPLQSCKVIPWAILDKDGLHFQFTATLLMDLGGTSLEKWITERNARLEKEGVNLTANDYKNASIIVRDIVTALRTLHNHQPRLCTGTCILVTCINTDGRNISAKVLDLSNSKIYSTFERFSIVKSFKSSSSKFSSK